MGYYDSYGTYIDTNFDWFDTDTGATNTPLADTALSANAIGMNRNAPQPQNIPTSYGGSPQPYYGGYQPASSTIPANTSSVPEYFNPWQQYAGTPASTIITGNAQPQQSSTDPFAGLLGSNDWGTNQTKYYNDLLNFQKNTQATADALNQKKYELESALGWASDANTKTQLAQQLMQINAQIDQTNQQLEQSKYEFEQTFGLSQQAQNWTQQYQQGQLDLTGNQQKIDQNNYLANLAANPVNWIQYNQAAGNPTVAQPWMQQLGGPSTGTVLGNTGGNTGGNNETQFGQFNTSSPLPYDQSPVQVGSSSPLPANQTAQPVGSTNSLGLSNLLTPSMQSYARMLPSQQEQYQGYQRALTGATPEDTQMQLWNRAAPSGNRYLTYGR
jgi:hypothetical protein